MTWLRAFAAVDGESSLMYSERFLVLTFFGRPRGIGSFIQHPDQNPRQVPTHAMTRASALGYMHVPPVQQDNDDVEVQATPA
ncbi:hypothetical protein GQ600_445 [Phytophthora cactorum]|nr:hypothetical protein GQ600_445 [Phytophthora cactorum]